MANVDLSRVPEFYHSYISRVEEDQLTEAFRKHQTDLVRFLTPIPEAAWNQGYGPGKWSLKEVVQHIIDAERIFGYRALCFSRKDKTPLPGFDETAYTPASKANRRTKEELIAELATVQQSSAQLFASFDKEQLNETGVSNGKPVYVEALGYILVGHARHHQNIIRERYLGLAPDQA
ncbi:MAG: DinB family protein [Flavisolibacter sp.]